MISVTELDERIERCLAILADNPHSQVFAALAEAYRRRGEFGRAFSVCRSGLKHHPDYAPAHIVMAKLYLHQNMIPEATAAVTEAVRIDGQTRATDMLEAELHLAQGDTGAAKAVISRLRQAQPRNPALRELNQALKKLEAGKNREFEAKAVGDRRQSPVMPAPAIMPKLRVPEVLPASWDEWAQVVVESAGVQLAAAFDADGTPLIVDTVDDRPETHAAVLHAMFRELDEQSVKSGAGSLAEVRIEFDKGEVWVGRNDGYTVGLIGDDQLAFGDARRRALTTVARPESGGTGAAGDDAYDPSTDDTKAESAAPQDVPVRDRAGAGQGHEDDS
jgi:hypothetical protein